MNMGRIEGFSPDPCQTSTLFCPASICSKRCFETQLLWDHRCNVLTAERQHLRSAAGIKDIVLMRATMFSFGFDSPGRVAAYLPLSSRAIEPSGLVTVTIPMMSLTDIWLISI